MPPSDREFPVSRELERLLSLFAAGDRPPHPDTPTPAAAIALIRDTAAGVQVFVTRQSDARGNADRNRWSFPGVELSPSDLRRLPLAGWSPGKCAEQLQMSSAGRALSYFAGAARAALLTTGILLAEDIDGRVVTTVDAPDWDDGRAELTERRLTFPQLLDDRSLRFRPDLLRPWLRWVNTPWQLRRFDTVFFVAALPHVQTLEFRSRNDSWGGWMTPAEVLEATGPSGAEHISVAARLVCESLAAVPTVGAAMARVRDVRPIHPEIVRHDEQWWATVPAPGESARGALRISAPADPQTSLEEESASLVDDDEEEEPVVDESGA